MIWTKTFWLGVLPRRQNKHVGEEEGEESCKNHLPYTFVVFPNLLLTLKFFLKVSLFIFSKALILGWGWGMERRKRIRASGSGSMYGSFKLAVVI